MAEERNPRGRRMMLGCLGVLVGVIAALWFWVGPLLTTASRRGFFDKTEMRTYQGNTMENLKRIHTALLQYEASEGTLPYADGWMDAAWARLQTADMSEEEAKKILRSPSLAKTNAVAFGYAFNEALSHMFSGDVKDPARTPLVFDSSDLTWNAYGIPAQLAPSPERPGGNYAVTVEGNVLKLADLLKK